MDGNTITGKGKKMNKPFVNPVEATNLLDNGKEVTPSFFIQIPDLLSQKEVSRLNNFIKEQKWIPVGLDGIKENFKTGDAVGSYRLSIYHEEMAKNLWRRLESIKDKLADNEWIPIGVNPLFRVIVYKEGGELVPHYDVPYIQDSTTMTRRSMVIYLTDNEEGSTDFLKDDQDGLLQKDFSDRPNYQGKLMTKCMPVSGASLIFDHRILHSVKPLKNENKIIIRTDIMYKRK